MIDDLMSDSEMMASDFLIVQKTWMEEDGVPELVDIDEIYASGFIHPADPTELDLLPAESRHDPIVLIHSTEPLSMGRHKGSVWTAPDEIHWDGRVFRVFQVRPWQAYGFWKAWAVELPSSDEDCWP